MVHVVENTSTEIGSPFIVLNTTRGLGEANLDRTPVVHLSWASLQPPNRQGTDTNDA